MPKVHHLNCASMCPVGRRVLHGEGGWLEPAPIVCHTLLIEGREGLTLVDTGFGTDLVAGRLPMGRFERLTMRPRLDLAETALAQIRALGFAAKDVRDIVLTHLDFDHAGGLADFPTARVHVNGPELAAALAPGTLKERARYVSAYWGHGPDWVRHHVEGETWQGFGAVRALGSAGGDDEVLLVPLEGHTRGHAGVAVRAGDGWLLHCGDAYFFHTEMAPPPRCPPGLAVYESLLSHDDGQRRANQGRLQVLVAARATETAEAGPKAGANEAVRVFCAHCPHELAACQHG